MENKRSFCLIFLDFSGFLVKVGCIYKKISGTTLHEFMSRFSNKHAKNRLDFAQKFTKKGDDFLLNYVTILVILLVSFVYI